MEAKPNKTTPRPARFLLQMRDDLREAIQQAADANGRTLTAEINTRLRESLAPKHGPTLTAILEREKAAKAQAMAPGGAYPISTAAAHPINNINAAQEKSPAPALTDLDRAMLTVFHQLPVEKQLALLSLFR